MAANDNWCMNVGGRIFGPYNTAQMQSFVGQKRLAYHSLVAPAGSRDFRPALQFPELRPFFKTKAQAEGASARPKARGRPLLVIFSTEHASEDASSSVLSAFDEVLPLSPTAYLLRTEHTAEAVRDALARKLPSTERALVLAAGKGPAAGHGISLNEHDQIASMLGRDEAAP